MSRWLGSDLIHWIERRCRCGEGIAGVVVWEGQVLAGCKGCVVRYARMVRRVETAAYQELCEGVGDRNQPMRKGEYWAAAQAAKAGDPEPLRAYNRKLTQRSRARRGVTGKRREEVALLGS